MNRKAIALAAFVGAGIVLAVITGRSETILISDKRCVREDGTNVVQFVAQNNSGATIKGTVEITGYSDRPDGISANPVVAGVKECVFTLKPGETRQIREERRLSGNHSSWFSYIGLT